MQRHFLEKMLKMKNYINDRPLLRRSPPIGGQTSPPVGGRLNKHSPRFLEMLIVISNSGTAKGRKDIKNEKLDK